MSMITEPVPVEHVLWTADMNTSDGAEIEVTGKNSAKSCNLMTEFFICRPFQYESLYDSSDIGSSGLTLCDRRLWKQVLCDALPQRECIFLFSDIVRIKDGPQRICL